MIDLFSFKKEGNEQKIFENEADNLDYNAILKRGEGARKLTDRDIEMLKIKVDSDDRKAKRAIDLLNAVGNIVLGVGNAVIGVTTVVACLKFEEAGAITSFASKIGIGAVINKVLKK